jgi:hypothetical protein
MRSPKTWDLSEAGTSAGPPAVSPCKRRLLRLLEPVTMRPKVAYVETSAEVEPRPFSCP